MINLETGAQNTWCPGCGNFLILTALKNVVKELVESGEVEYENIVISSGIGCHGKIVDYIKVNSFYSIHGRVPPTISGIKLANPKLKVIGFAGDGDAYAEGISHLIHAAKRNSDITMVVHDNQVFALTTGQFTPTTPKGAKTRTTPHGNPEEPLNPIALMLVSGATFVARGFAGDLKHLQELLKEAIKHKGFAFIDVLQPCVTFNDTFKFYRERVYKLEETGHDPTSFEKALEKAWEWGERIPIGVFYKVEKPTFEEVILKGKIPVNEKRVETIKEVLMKYV
ncbi:MAG: 2-oxoacid:ferredoxin oxidoreductase subunit beta [Candidatus Aenigmarchaeota archaeon]|nr:2-oxoacid:ferredoxin oxidoreductase subunit beta [Candidatus Aenigmarchaeota archaeon]